MPAIKIDFIGGIYEKKSIKFVACRCNGGWNGWLWECGKHS